jgi:hypothetical protein
VDTTLKKRMKVKETTTVVGQVIKILSFFTAIIRYLGSRFQETLMATDEDNRTALHYAATIKDNGHFYNLLMHLGANPKTVDNVRF